MTLSDKIVLEQTNEYLCLSVSDVKAFIKELKKYGREQGNRFDCKAFEHDIDKLAGDKLL